MQELQELNPEKDTATKRADHVPGAQHVGADGHSHQHHGLSGAAGAANPSDVFLPILLATFFSTMAGLIAVALVQRINLLDRVVLTYLLGVTAAVAATILYFSSLPQDRIQTVSNLVANVTLYGIIAAFITLAVVRRVNVYEAFIEGAKEGFRRRRQDHPVPGRHPGGDRGVPRRPAPWTGSWPRWGRASPRSA